MQLVPQSNNHTATVYDVGDIVGGHKFDVLGSPFISNENTIFDFNGPQNLVPKITGTASITRIGIRASYGVVSIVRGRYHAAGNSSLWQAAESPRRETKRSPFSIPSFAFLDLFCRPQN
jgi:hypothetical protein